MEKCANCGEALLRVHRSVFQQLWYSAAFKCRRCGGEEYAPRAFRFHFSKYVHCPVCGSLRVTSLKKRDRIDPMYWSLLAVAEWLLSRGHLFHCAFCRVQFYDRRRIAPDPPSNT